MPNRCESSEEYQSERGADSGFNIVKKIQEDDDIMRFYVKNRNEMLLQMWP